MFGASAFVYDDAYPPLCCRSDREVDLNVIRKAIGMHLVESSRDGVKHPDALLECGMTAGEAAVFHIRDISNRRRPVREDAGHPGLRRRCGRASRCRTGPAAK